MNEELTQETTSPPETPAFSELKTLVQTGKLEIMYIVSPPRTVSTALEIALTESANGQIHEPFHIGRSHTFNEGCQLILDRYRQLEKDADGYPVRLVVKDLVKHLDLKEWIYLLKLSRECIFLIREPTLQLHSLITRRANDLQGFGSDTLSPDEVLAQIPRIPDKKIMEGSWERLSYILELMEGVVGQKIAIISSLSLRNNPRGTIERLKKYFGWETPTDQILTKWEKGAGKNFFMPDIKYRIRGRTFTLENAWLRAAFESRRFFPLNPDHDKPKPLSYYPDKVVTYFLENILPVYIHMLMNPLNLSRPDFQDLVSEDTTKSTLLSINPIEAYTLCQSYINLPAEQEEKRRDIVQRLKLQIEREYPLLANRLFSLVDQRRIILSS